MVSFSHTFLQALGFGSGDLSCRSWSESLHSGSCWELFVNTGRFYRTSYRFAESLTDVKLFPQHFLDALASLKTMLDIQSFINVFKITVVQSVTEYYRVLQSIAEYCRVLQSVRECYSVTECYRV